MAKEKTAKEKKPSKPSKKAKSGRKKGGALLVFFMVVVSLAIIVMFQEAYVLFVAGMLPSFVAYYVDRTPSRSLFHTVMPCNLAGVLPFLVGFITNESHNASMITMFDFLTLLKMYLSAAVGWGLVYAAPQIAAFIISLLNRRQIAHLRATQKRLTQEWGSEVTRLETQA